LKRVVSISLGSSSRDKKVNAQFFGVDFEIERIGTDGDMDRFRHYVANLDGKVDAFGVGGTDIYVYAGNKRYVLNEIVHGAIRRKPTRDLTDATAVLTNQVLEVQRARSRPNIARLAVHSRY